MRKAREDGQKNEKRYSCKDNEVALYLCVNISIKLRIF